MYLKFRVLFLALEQIKNESSVFEQGLGCSPGSRSQQYAPRSIFLSVFLSFLLSVSLSCTCMRAHTVLLCAPGWPLSGASVSQLCLPSVGIAGICYCPAHSTVFSFNSPAAACWSSGCGTDAMKSLTRFLILDGFWFFGSLISRLNLWSFSSDRGITARSLILRLWQDYTSPCSWFNTVSFVTCALDLFSVFHRAGRNLEQFVLKQSCCFAVRSIRALQWCLQRGSSLVSKYKFEVFTCFCFGMTFN